MFLTREDPLQTEGVERKNMQTSGSYTVACLEMWDLIFGAWRILQNMGRDINVDSIKQAPSSHPSICSGRCRLKPTLTLGGFITEVDTVSDVARRMEIWGVSENSIGDHPPPSTR